MTQEEKHKLRLIILSLEKLIESSEARVEKRLSKGWQDIDRTYPSGERQLANRLDRQQRLSLAA